jgi:hypothetical protein
VEKAFWHLSILAETKLAAYAAGKNGFYRRVRGDQINMRSFTMKKRSLLITLAVIVSLLAVGSCASTDRNPANQNNSRNSSTSVDPKDVNKDGGISVDKNPVIQTDPGKSYASVDSKDLFREGGSGNLTITNKASFDVIIFAGKVDNNNVLGGIKSGKDRTFDLKTLGLPGKNGSFLIRAASYSAYTRKNLRVTEEDVIYSGLVVYDLNNPYDKTHLNIFGGVSESSNEYIWVSNRSKFVLELRVGTPNGEKLATLAPAQVNKAIPLVQNRVGNAIMPYEFYPTYVYIDPRTNEITSFSSKGMEERWRRMPSATLVNPMEFTGPVNTSSISYLVGFLRISNQTNQSLNPRNGGTWLFDQKGIPLVEGGQIQTFELPALSGEAGQPYTGIEIEFDRWPNMPINRIDIRPGWVYDMIISTKDGRPAYDIRPTQRKDYLEDMQMSLFLGD